MTVVVVLCFFVVFSTCLVNCFTLLKKGGEKDIGKEGVLHFALVAL